MTGIMSVSQITMDASNANGPSGTGQTPSYTICTCFMCVCSLFVSLWGHISFLHGCFAPCSCVFAVMCLFIDIFHVVGHSVSLCGSSLCLWIVFHLLMAIFIFITFASLNFEPQENFNSGFTQCLRPEGWQGSGPEPLCEATVIHFLLWSYKQPTCTCILLKSSVLGIQTTAALMCFSMLFFIYFFLCNDI